eukprot:CAMPEP_0172494544 /NCGR_PEP_ID=MMETSP1066-20121228/51201_1 /TAXON_ID=671091 /ORGANISM="Coscinodiscus wailesii, Strain CCMP2513" /LENGTH=280 /DNA_ID=CAMNT_0013265607 /DNA_START=27 /DNA_END=869 /DNA_ORIENTATION=-
MRIFAIGYIVASLSAVPAFGVNRGANVINEELPGNEHGRDGGFLNRQLNDANDECDACGAQFQEGVEPVGTLTVREVTRLVKSATNGEKVSYLPEGLSSEQRITLRNVSVKVRSGHCNCGTMYELSGTWRRTQEMRTYSFECCTDNCMVYPGEASCVEEDFFRRAIEYDNELKACPCENIVYGGDAGHLGTILAVRSKEDGSSAAKLVKRAMEGGKVNITYTESDEAIILKETSLESLFLCDCSVHAISGKENDDWMTYTLRCCNEYCSLYGGAPECPWE